tara:strand:- start:7844 stop:8050 length:207 start_codon:yes stop_codon:yes gene_type:complete
MKKIFLIILLTGCSVKRDLNYQINTITKMQSMIDSDYELGKIEYGIANNYYMLLETIKYDLHKINNDK